jgi:hypothetical protein
MRTDAKSALLSTVSTADLVIEGVKQGIISPDDAISQLYSLEQDMNSQERSVNFWNKLYILHYLGGGKDAMVDIANARIDFQNKRAALMQTIVRLNKTGG